MADNYLEKKMDDLRRGVAWSNSEPRRTSPQGNRPGKLVVDFPPRRVLVTGGCNGIGYGVVSAYLRVGCKVAVFDIDSEKGNRMAREEGVRFYEVDLRDKEQIEKAFDNLLKAWRDVDIIVSNAGISRFADITEQAPEEFDDTFAVNARPLYLLGRQWALHRSKYPCVSDFKGRLIAISSTRHLQSEKGTEPYSASKGAVLSLTHSLMMSLSEYGITVNCISPGWIVTTDDVKLRQGDLDQHPSRRVGKPEDIARVCMFLSLPDNDFINGTDIVVDGGMTRKMIYLEDE